MGPNVLSSRRARARLATGLLATVLGLPLRSSPAGASMILFTGGPVGSPMGVEVRDLKAGRETRRRETHWVRGADRWLPAGVSSDLDALRTETYGAELHDGDGRVVPGRLKIRERRVSRTARLRVGRRVLRCSLTEQDTFDADGRRVSRTRAWRSDEVPVSYVRQVEVRLEGPSRTNVTHEERITELVLE